MVHIFINKIFQIHYNMDLATLESKVDTTWIPKMKEKEGSRLETQVQLSLPFSL